MPTGQISLRWLPQPGLPGLWLCLGRPVDLIASQRPRVGGQARVGMALLNDDARNQVSEALGGLSRPVLIRLFVRETGCPMCKESQALLKEVAQVSDRLSVEVVDVAA